MMRVDGNRNYKFVNNNKQPQAIKPVNDYLWLRAAAIRTPHIKLEAAAAGFIPSWSLISRVFTSVLLIFQAHVRMVALVCLYAAFCLDQARLSVRGEEQPTPHLSGG